MDRKLVEFVLTCSSWQAAQRIADALLETRLVSSVETFEVKTNYTWESHIHGKTVVKLIMLGSHKNFNLIWKVASDLQGANSEPILLHELNK